MVNANCTAVERRFNSHRSRVSRCQPPFFYLGMNNHYDLNCCQDDTWYGAGSVWLKVTPWGLRSTLNWLAVEYGPMDIYITENGFSDK